MSVDEYGPWDAWKRKADEMDGDQYYTAQDPEYVIDLLKTAEGRCVIDSTTAHKDVALASTFGTARRTMERLFAKLRDARNRLDTIRETNPEISLDHDIELIDIALGPP